MADRIQCLLGCGICFRLQRGQVVRPVCLGRNPNPYLAGFPCRRRQELRGQRESHHAVMGLHFWHIQLDIDVFAIFRL